MKAILTYHSVDETGSVISVTPAELERHLDFLLAAGASVVPLSELARAAESPDCIALTFDDGYTNFALSAAPILARRGLTATVFVVPSFVGSHNDWETIDSRLAVPRLPLMTWEEIARVRSLGFDVGGHGLTHRSLRGADAKTVTEEVEGCFAAFEENSGDRPDAFAFPYGDCDSSAIEIVSRVFSIACTTRFDVVREDDSVHALPRLDMFYFRDGRMLKRWNTLAFQAYVGARRFGRSVRRGLPTRRGNA